MRPPSCFPLPLSPLVLLSCLALTAPAAGDGPTTIFVGIDAVLAEEKTAAERKDLRDSAEDVRAQIRKRSTLRVVERPDEAAIRLIVLDRRIEVGVSGETNYGAGHRQRQYQSRHVLAYRLESKTVRHEGETALAGSFVTWKRVAGTLVKDVEIWAQDIGDSR